jgi:hypothetical protein
MRNGCPALIFPAVECRKGSARPFDSMEFSGSFPQGGGQTQRTQEPDGGGGDDPQLFEGPTPRGGEFRNVQPVNDDFWGVHGSWGLRKLDGRKGQREEEPATGRFRLAVIHSPGVIGAAFDVVAQSADILSQTGGGIAGRQHKEAERGDGEKNEGFHVFDVEWNVRRSCFTEGPAFALIGMQCSQRFPISAWHVPKAPPPGLED